MNKLASSVYRQLQWGKLWPLSSSPKPALPEDFRELIKLSIKQAHRAFEIWITAGEDVGRSIANRSGFARSNGAVALRRKMADITRANAAANFSTALKLADSEHIGHAMALCADHVGKQVTALAGQIEDISKLTFQIILEGAGVHGIGEPIDAAPSPQETASLGSTPQPLLSQAKTAPATKADLGVADPLPMVPTGESPDAAATPANTGSSTLASWRSAAAGQSREKGKVEGAPSTVSLPQRRAPKRGVDATAQNADVNPGQNARSDVGKFTSAPQHVKDDGAPLPKKVPAKTPRSNSQSVAGAKTKPQNAPRVAKGKKSENGRRSAETRNFADWIKKSPRPKTRSPR